MLVIWFPEGNEGGHWSPSFIAHPLCQSYQFLTPIKQHTTWTAKDSRTRAGSENANGQPDLTDGMQGKQKPGTENSWNGYSLVNQLVSWLPHG